LEGRIAEPDDPSFVMRDLGAVVVVRLEVSMDDGMRVPNIRFVEVLLRDERRRDDARREHEGNRRAPQ
jgi:hypothetical protein